jgi:putative phosphonate metabolism protein
MEGYARYAIYWAPASGSALARFGAAWLGWDPEARTSTLPIEAGLPDGHDSVTARPRHYGFHATLKAPFRLAAAYAPGDLARAAADLAARHAAFDLPRLVLAEEGDFLALVPAEPCPGLDALAGDCVRGLDRFRAALTRDERERRRPGLTARQAELLDRWGYPFVLDQFRFHLTLSGPLDPGRRRQVAAALAPMLAPILADRLRVNEICLFGEPHEGHFHLLARFGLDERNTDRRGSA